MKKILAFVLAFSFTASAFASSAATALEKRLDEYQYALSVDWDQKDQRFYDAQTNAFFADLQRLVTEKGLKQEEIMALAEKKIADKNALEAIKLKLALVGNDKNPSELASVVRDISKDLYTKGASWNGEVLIPVAIGVVVVAVVGYAVWFSATHECVAYDQRWDCDSYTHCNSSGSYCWTDTNCGWEDYCTEYVKK